MLPCTTSPQSDGGRCGCLRRPPLLSSARRRGWAPRNDGTTEAAGVREDPPAGAREDAFSPLDRLGRQLVSVELVGGKVFASSHWHVVDQLMSGGVVHHKGLLAEEAGDL